jgi:N6-L-threonylcarbamoyladenine synthase
MELGMTEQMNILGIESSCDDTAAAVVRGTAGGSAEVLSSIVVGQTELHAAFGGVVPEIAARAHAEKLDVSVVQALAEAELTLEDIDAIAVTAGPGLIGGVVSGVMLAKGISTARSLPLYGVNHLAGHALTPRLTDNVTFPYLMLLVSGGHCQFLIAHDAMTFERLGGTIDDAPGEAFDKVARLIGLVQPGGPSIERAALAGDEKRFALPRPLLDRPDCDMSFSGLKTAALRARDSVVAEKGGLSAQDQSDLAAGFQAAVAQVLAVKSKRALQIYLEIGPSVPTLCVAGGVASNMTIRSVLETVCHGVDAAFVAPPLRLCTDNAAMIAFAALAQMPVREADDMTLSAKPRMPLDTRSQPMLGSGKKGAKA